MQTETKEKTKKQKAKKAEYDSPWKNILDHFFQSFMEFCLPEIAAKIDWSRGYVSLENELNAVAHGQKIGKRVADKLFKVWLKEGGQEVWLLFHIEIQASKENNFMERIYIYDYRFFDRHEKPINSIAILIDDNPHWRPNQYERVSYCSKIYFQFTSVKLLDYYTPEPPSISEANAFAVIAWAHLHALKTRKKPTKLLQTKLSITRALYKCGFDKAYIVKLYEFIEWIILNSAVGIVAKWANVLNLACFLSNFCRRRSHPYGEVKITQKAR